MTDMRIPSVDANGRIYDEHLPTRLTQASLVELIQDTVGTSVEAGSGSGLTVTYDDAAGTVLLNSAGTDGTLATVKVTAAEYAALGVKDPNTLYVVVG